MPKGGHVPSWIMHTIHAPSSFEQAPMPRYGRRLLYWRVRYKSYLWVGKSTTTARRCIRIRRGVRGAAQRQFHAGTENKSRTSCA